MDYINRLREQNITFVNISESQALDIIKTNYSYYRLMEYSPLFEKYKISHKANQFVNLDFSQLYYLAIIDSELRSILMTLCLEIENSLKTKLIYDAESVCDTNTLINEYYVTEKEFLDSIYTCDNNDTLNEYMNIHSLKDLKLDKFLDVIQFGTLERFIHYFYKKYHNLLKSKTFNDIEIHLSSVRRIRNIVAHNNTCISKINEITEYKDLKMLSFLGNHGIKKRTLSTNMSKKIISDLCGLIDVYFKLVDNKNVFEKLKVFNENYCIKYKKVFINNDKLISSYDFIKNVIKIYFFLDNDSKL